METGNIPILDSWGDGAAQGKTILFAVSHYPQLIRAKRGCSASGKLAAAHSRGIGLNPNWFGLRKRPRLQGLNNRGYNWPDSSAHRGTLIFGMKSVKSALRRSISFYFAALYIERVRHTAGFLLMCITRWYSSLFLATNRTLKEEVKEGRIRQDLIYRQISGLTQELQRYARRIRQSGIAISIFINTVNTQRRACPAFYPQDHGQFFWADNTLEPG